MASIAVYPIEQQQSDPYEADRWNGPDEWGFVEGAWQREIARPSQCQIRTFPNEDILFWSKPEIDNGRVVRQQDPNAVTDCWKGFSAAVAVVVLAVGLLLPKAYGLISGMQLEQLRQQNAELRERERVVALEEGRLTNPERIEKMARDFGFEPPSPERMARLENGGASGDGFRNASNR
jgi:hypothetical protein